MENVVAEIFEFPQVDGIGSEPDATDVERVGEDSLEVWAIGPDLQATA